MNERVPNSGQTLTGSLQSWLSRVRRRSHWLSGASLLVLAAVDPAAAQTTWVLNSDGDWNTASNWNPAVVPGLGASEDVLVNVGGPGTTITVTHSSGTHQINAFASEENPNVAGGMLIVDGVFRNTAMTMLSGGTLTLNGDSSISSLAVNGGQVAGAGGLTVTGAAMIDYGGQSGAGTTTLRGATTIGGSVYLDGGRELRNEGTVTQTGTVNLNQKLTGAVEAGTGRVVNAAGGVWTASDNSSIHASYQDGSDTGAGATFGNAGTFNHTGTGTSYVSVAFDNTGTVDVQGGTLSLSGGGTHTGAFAIGADATLNLAGGTHDINTGSTVASASTGTLAISGGVVNVNTSLNIAGTTALLNGYGVVMNLGAGTTVTTGALTQSYG